MQEYVRWLLRPTVELAKLGLSMYSGRDFVYPQIRDFIAGA